VKKDIQIDEPAKRTSEGGTRERTVGGLILKDRKMTCPHCEVALIVGSPMSRIFMAEGKCPNCERDFLIVNDVPMTSSEYGHRQKAA
jgi:predicted RNA-binding Zn-ribbon protein involved in translation (DUF1610 family)